MTLFAFKLFKMAYVPYLIVPDYYTVQQPGLLSQLFTNDIERKAAESWGITTINSYLSAKYNTQAEFTNTLPYDYTKSYGANDRVVIDFADWVADTAYSIGDLVIYEDYGYICTTANSDATFTVGNWKVMGQQYAIFSIPLPYPLFEQMPQPAKGPNRAGVYKVGDVVWWAGHTYTCLRPTIIGDYDSVIQYPSYNAIPAPNYFPDDPKNGSTYWHDEGAYVIAAGEYPTIDPEPIGAPPWELSDNRDPTIVNAVVMLSLWRLFKRIAPMNVPDHIMDEFKRIMDWLDCVKRGDLTTEVRQNQPETQYRIAWNSQPKQRNGYT